MTTLAISPPADPAEPSPTTPLSRRAALAGFGLLMLGGCSRSIDIGLPGGQPKAAAMTPPVPSKPAAPPVNEDLKTASVGPNPGGYGNLGKPDLMYGAMSDNGFRLPAIPAFELKVKHLRRLVVDPTGEAPGTIVVHLRERHLYLVQENGDAIRYGVSIGKEGFVWSGRAVVDHTRKWPTWTPPAEMVKRKPALQKFAGGQPGGLDNPLGARALYVYKDGVDTLYRIHGTPEWRSIGKAASSGCVRMINQDVIDLYDRVKGKGKTPIVVVA
ncbi:L,D-transpeptidase [Mesorhizobium sp. LHD-90]|uniref:L,D-transpeptidase n=1 Tax=Mesorhizobium sp. LHD-90 TaxID=3071414 RepID=UPI0027E1641E|nr:L,D-transpeptidase [Mesorhizobium sp. LHD-90]MDQ6437350.1 L,D-transpeptidase [Mesorhizobium sp. LHD-90]